LDSPFEKDTSVESPQLTDYESGDDADERGEGIVQVQ
jgi:hypothetical protein